MLEQTASTLASDVAAGARNVRLEVAEGDRPTSAALPWPARASRLPDKRHASPHARNDERPVAVRP